MTTNLLSLSPELYAQIFSYLDPVHRTCLALSSKPLYLICRTIYKPLSLDAFTYECPVPLSNQFSLCFLYIHLQEWKPADLKYCGGCHKFCRTSNNISAGRGRCDRCSANEVGSEFLDWMRDVPSVSRFVESEFPVYQEYDLTRLDRLSANRVSLTEPQPERERTVLAALRYV